LDADGAGGWFIREQALEVWAINSTDSSVEYERDATLSSRQVIVGFTVTDERMTENASPGTVTKF